MNKRGVLTFTAAVLALAACVYINLITGTVKLTGNEVLSILTGSLKDPLKESVLINIRLPRVAAGIISGGALALSGYLLQTFFDNPIVGPFVLGISSGAKLTVALALILMLKGGVATGSLYLVGAAFIGAMAVMGFVLLMSLKVRTMSILVVCGIMTGYICSAITDLVITFADDSNIVNLHNWSMGSLSGMSREDIRIMAVITLICLAGSLLIIKPLGAYRLGEAYAAGGGVNITLLRICLILISSLLAACVTAFAGPISFVGIAVPHLMKNLTGTGRPSVMIPGCFLLGALVTTACDLAARSLFAPSEVSISSVTAVFLVPVIIAIMMGRRKRLDRE